MPQGESATQDSDTQSMKSAQNDILFENWKQQQIPDADRIAQSNE